MSTIEHGKLLKIVWHPSAKSVHDAMWAQAMAAEGVPVSEVEDVMFHADTEFGESIVMTQEQILAAIEDQGMWGFVDTEARVIHAWAGPTADPADILHMLAHEVGHATGEPAADAQEEEARADVFGAVAAEAFRLMAMRPGFDLNGRAIGGKLPH